MFGQRNHVSVPAASLTALNAVRANVMIADCDLNIIYMNPSVAALMREAEADLKLEMPHFNASKLIGANIDVFHKNPTHQRRMLASLEKPHAAMIRIGTRSFDLLVCPLTEKGRRIGFVVEWADAKDRLLNIDYAGQIAAINRSQACVTFSVDGVVLDCNKNFLDAMGYAREEVLGKHHSMFVDPAYGKSREYQEFWERLRRNEFQAAQFKRIGKGGIEVWIEGAYNPIVDVNGKVTKVVKFATNITAQIKLLSDLKILIDQNFGDIDGAIALSSSEAGSASIAVGETSSNVQSVAASAEQLAASIGEIAQSMVQSRTATDSAFDQTVAVGKNTDTLAQAAQAMNGIVALIRSIASQINLLALNATIEAARAGDAGKGFAVVASEVKNLAVQASKATEQISSEIDAIQSTSQQVASALTEIRQAVTTVRESVTLTAAAVEEQSAVTKSMSANMHMASGSVATAATNVVKISSAVEQAHHAVAKTKQAAQVLVR
jgi:PAS domain S-box-containing protein